MLFRPSGAEMDSQTISDASGPNSPTTPTPSIREFLLPDVPAADSGASQGDGVLPEAPPSNWHPLPEVPRDGVLGATLALRVLMGGTPAQLHALPGPLISIGRELDNTLALPDAKVSRHHARIEHLNGAWVLTDLNSTNGVRLNGLPVTRAGLSAGDFLYLGDTVIRVEPAEAPDEAAPPPAPHLSQYDLGV